MASFRLSSLFSQGSGKLGPNVILKGRDNVVGVRERVTPANPRTAAQLAVRAAQTESSQLWDTLSESQAQSWRDYAASLPQTSNKTGRAIKKQGFNAFCGLADRFRLANPGGTVPLDPPTAKFLGDAVTVTATASAGYVTFTGSGPNAAGVTTEVLLQRLPGKNRVPTAGGYRVKGYRAFTSGRLSLAVPAGTAHWAPAYRFVNSLTGQAGPIKPLPLVTVALSVAKGGAPEGEPQAKAKKAA